MQTFTDDFPLNSMQNLPVIASESEEKFDFYPSNVAAGVKICNTLDIFEKISDYKSDQFPPHVLDFSAKSSTQSIRIEESLHAVNPSPDAPEVHEIYDISYPHIYEIEKYI